MKIIFMGTPEFAVPSLKTLLENNLDIAAVVTVPDRKKGRGQNVSASEVKNFALKNNLKILQPVNLKDEYLYNELKSLDPDLIVIVAFRILPEKIFTLPKYGSINLHASLLPKYRGAAPINWAVINGDSETGVTTFFLKNKVDTGNLILQEKIKIGPDDDAGSVHDKLSVLGSDVLLKTIRLIETENVQAMSQNENLSSAAPKIFKDDCMINWDQESTKIHNFIRGLSPYPAAFTYLQNHSIKIFKSRLSEVAASDIPGKLLFENRKLFASTKDYLLEILELQSEGKKRVNSSDFINGLKKEADLFFQ